MRPGSGDRPAALPRAALQPLAMLLDHSQVIRGGKRRHPLRNQVIASEPGTNLDEVARLADLRNTLGQDQLDVAVLGPAGMILAALDAGLARRTGRRGLVREPSPVRG